MSVVVGAATRQSAAIAADSSYYRLVDGHPVLADGPPKVFRAGQHVAGVAGVADYGGTSFLEVLRESLEAVDAIEKLPDYFVSAANGPFVAAFHAWLAAGVFETAKPERFFEAVIAWSGTSGVELWRLATTRRDDGLSVVMTAPAHRPDAAVVLVAGARDDLADDHDSDRRLVGHAEARLRREPTPTIPSHLDAAALGRQVADLVEAQLDRGLQPPPTSDWPLEVPVLARPVYVVTLEG